MVSALLLWLVHRSRCRSPWQLLGRAGAEGVRLQQGREAVVEVHALLRGMQQVSSPRRIGLIGGLATILNVG